MTSGAAAVAETVRVAGAAIGNDVARAAIGEAIAIGSQVAKQVTERSDSRGAAAVVDDVAGAASVSEVAAIKQIAARAAVVKRVAASRCEEVSQASAHCKTGSAAHFVARTASGKRFVAGIASNDWFARIAVVGSDSAHQSFQSGKHIAAAFRSERIARSTRRYACRITRIRKTLYTQHKGDDEGCH